MTITTKPSFCNSFYYTYLIEFYYTYLIELYRKRKHDIKTVWHPMQYAQNAKQPFIAIQMREFFDVPNQNNALLERKQTRPRMIKNKILSERIRIYHTHTQFLFKYFDCVIYKRVIGFRSMIAVFLFSSTNVENLIICKPFSYFISQN